MNGRGYRTCWMSATRPLVYMGGALPGKKKRRKRKKERGRRGGGRRGRARREREDLTLLCVLESVCVSVYIYGAI